MPNPGAPRAVPFRIFVAGREVQVAEADPAVELAMDIMMADRVPADKAADLAVAAAKAGKDPIAFAEHFVKVRRRLRH